MTDDGRVSAGAPFRPRKPTLAERRERRAGVDDVAEILDAAARFLEARPRSVAEVRRKLTSMGYQAALVESVLARLEELGYLDDEAFARAWVESRDRATPRGEHALRRELALKGIDRSLVDIVLEERREAARETAGATAHEEEAPAEATASPDEAAATRLLRKRLPAILREPDPRRRRQRAYGLLARSGFAPDVCSSVTRRVLDEDSAARGDDDLPAG
jgi:regulatory protein